MPSVPHRPGFPDVGRRPTKSGRHPREPTTERNPAIAAAETRPSAVSGRRDAAHCRKSGGRLRNRATATAFEPCWRRSPASARRRSAAPRRRPRARNPHRDRPGPAKQVGTRIPRLSDETVRTAQGREYHAGHAGEFRQRLGLIRALQDSECVERDPSHPTFSLFILTISLRSLPKTPLCLGHIRREQRIMIPARVLADADARSSVSPAAYSACRGEVFGTGRQLRDGDRRAEVVQSGRRADQTGSLIS